MLAKLLALVTQLKAAGVTVVILAGATTATVAATSPEVQDAVNQLTTNVGLTRSCDDGQGQPAVVAQRNAADKLLRAAYQKDLKALEDLRGGKDQDNKAVGEIVRNYSDQLRGVLNTALNKSAALTLGREGQVRKAVASASGAISPATAPTPAGTTSASPKPTCTPAPAAVVTTASPSPSPSPAGSGAPSATGSSKPEQGRVTVAERTTLDAALQAIVDQAVKDMDDLVTKATTEVAAVPAPEHGKPSDNPGNKPSDKGKPSDNPGNKPSDKGKPTTNP